MPVVAVSDRAVHGVDLQQVAALVGLHESFDPQLAPQELKHRQGKLLTWLDAVIDTLPSDTFDIPIPGRDRTVWTLIEHVCEIGQVYRRVAIQQADFDSAAAEAEVHPRHNRHELQSAIASLQAALIAENENYARVIETYFGEASLHVVLERCTWHIAQHLRQLES